MNKIEDKVIEWSLNEFNVKNASKESLNIFRTKNGNTFKKLLNFMSERLKSKENGETIKRFYDSIETQNQLKAMETEIQDIESKIGSIRNELKAEEFDRKSVEIKDNFNENKAMVSTLLLQVVEEISLKNKLCHQLRPNLMTINGTVDSIETLFTPFEDLNSDINCCFDESLSKHKNMNQIMDQICQLIENIETILYDLTEVKAIKEINVSYDLQLLSKALTKSDPKIEVLKLKNENDSKISSIALKLSSVKSLAKKYQTIRLELLSKNKEKLEKVIKSFNNVNPINKTA